MSPGAVALYRDTWGAPSFAGEAPARAVMGRLESALPAGSSGRWLDQSVRVRLLFGTLAARPDLDVLGGANTLLVAAANGAVEVLQFRDAALEPDGAWRLSRLLRGQAGGEAEAAAGAAVGARVAVLSPAMRQIAFPADLRGLSLTWRAGPAGALTSAPSFATETLTLSARGLVPLSPVHLRARAEGGGFKLTWIRRTRIGGDDWSAPDAPLGEAFERYLVEILRGGGVVRSLETDAASYSYTAADIAADGGSSAGFSDFSFRAAQLSERVGAGPFSDPAPFL